MTDFEDQRNALAVLDSQFPQGWLPKQDQLRTFTPKQAPKRFEEMTLLELEQCLEREESVLAEQYAIHEKMPAMGLGDRLHKIAYKIALIRNNIEKHGKPTVWQKLEKLRSELGDEKYFELLK